MGILLGLAAALLYGGSDFSGGLASRRFGPVRVTVLGAAVSTVLAWVALIVSGGPGPDIRAIAWGLASGLAGGIGNLALYRGMACGRMSVVGPVSAVGAAAVAEPARLARTGPRRREATPPAKSELPYNRAAARPNRIPMIIPQLAGSYSSTLTEIGPDDKVQFDAWNQDQF